MGDFENVRFIANLVVTLLITPLAMVIWYQLRHAQQTADSVAEELAKHRLHATETYATKSSVDQAVNRLETSVERAFERFDRKLDAIDTKLDRKADK